MFMSSLERKIMLLMRFGILMEDFMQVPSTFIYLIILFICQQIRYWT